MAEIFASPKPDRERLMTAFLDAVEFIKTLTVTEQERNDATDALLNARRIMEKHPQMQSFSVVPFFSHLEMDEGRLLRLLADERLTKCHQFMEASMETLSRIAAVDEEDFCLPLALQVLRFVYGEFQSSARPPL